MKKGNMSVKAFKLVPAIEKVVLMGEKSKSVVSNRPRGVNI